MEELRKKELRKSDDSVICGVCGGFAEYFGIDPTIIRLIWGIAAFCFGVGVGAYFVCVLVMPD